MNPKAVMAYLAKKGVPKSMLQYIRIALTEDAVVNSDNIKFNRILTAMSLMLHRKFGMTDEQIVEAIHYFDEINGAVVSGEKEWGQLMHELEQETGLIIRYGEDDFCEYRAENEQEEG